MVKLGLFGARPTRSFVGHYAETAERNQLSPFLLIQVRLLPAGSRLRWSRSGFLCAVNPYCPNPLPSDTPEGIMPGPFDDAVDMGPDAWSAKLRQGSAV